MKHSPYKLTNILIAAILLAGAFVSPAAFMSSATAIADAGPNQTVDVNVPVVFDGSGSGGVGSLLYTWYYRDGTEETVSYPNPTHTYTKEGVYEVGLLVEDGNGYYDLDTVQITVKNEYPTAVAGPDLVVDEDEVVYFNGSTSWDVNNDIVSYDWDFGESSTSNLTATSISYDKAGVYQVTLTVTDNDGAFDRDTVTVTVNNVVPTAQGSANSETGTLEVYEDEPVTFDASMSTDTPSDIPLLKYAWDFGDTSSGAGIATSHTYTKEGTYEVTLTVTDDDDDFSQDTITINVLNADPVADPGQDMAVDEGSSLFFDGSPSHDTPSDEPMMDYSWDFETDGGNDDSGWYSKNTWWDDCDHTTTLGVQDDNGAGASEPQEITVNNVDPLPGIFNYSTEESTLVNFSLRITGEKWHDVEMFLYEDHVEIGHIFMVRMPGDPNEQMKFINDVEVYAERTYYADISYTPEDDPVNGQLNGANPCWLGLHLEDGNVFRFHRAFNYNKPDEWEWNVDLSSIAKVNFDAEIYDPGMDNIIFTWDFGDGMPMVSHFYPSTGTYPTRVADSIMHIYVIPTTYTVTLHGYDDDWGHDTFSCALSNNLSEIVVDNLAPRAEAESSVTGAVEDELFDFNGFGTDVLGDALTYQWDFDDGSTSTGNTVNHSFADEGVYHVTLTVSDSFGTSAKDTIFVTVTNENPIAEAKSDYIGYEDDTVDFDAFDSWDTDSDYNVLEFAWDFGDGSKGEGCFASHVYTRTGFYIVTLTVTDNNGEVSTDTVNVTVINPIPYDLSIGTDHDVDEDTLLFFTGSASDTPSDSPGLSYLWNFGDGTTGHGRSPTHSYSYPGAFHVTLTVTDDDSDSDHINATILVENVMPEAFAGPTSIKLYGPAVTLDFSGLGFDTFSDESSLAYSWWLGPGTIEYTPAVSKSFSATGIYEIRFRVRDVHLGQSAVIRIRIDFAMDSDGDSLTDETESSEGTNAAMWDTDNDNLIDQWEVYTYPTDPLQPDTDFDDLNDWEEITFFGLTDPDGDGLVNPVDWDSDGEWISDGIDVHPLQYDDTDGTPLTLDAIAADHYIGYGVSVVMYGGSAYAKPTISTAAPQKPLQSGIGIYANIRTTDSPPFSSQIRMRYSESILPPGMSENRLCMFYWDNVLKDWEITEDTGVDTTHNFVWAKVTHFTVFGIGDIASLDSDNDGLNNWAEMTSEHTARFYNYRWFTTSRYSMGQSLYVKNSRAQYQVPSSQITKDGSQAVGTVDLFSLGFIKADFAIADSWKLTNGGSKVYITVYPIGLRGTRSASVEFSLNTLVVGVHVMSLYVKAPTNPRDADTDDDGKWDGYEVNTFRTSPVDPDTDNDGYDDGTDLNPLINLKLSVKIKEILQFDKVDTGSKGDFYLKIYIDDYWYEPSWKSSNNAHVYPNFAVNDNIPDNKRYIPVKIQLWDSDSNPDDRLDIARGGDIMDVTFDVKTGLWSGEDFIGDRNGFGHTSGNEDGSVGSDDDDCDVWFDIYTNDNDGDRLTFWEEVHVLGTDPTVKNSDTDSDGMPDWWEVRFGLSRTGNDANSDPDKDHLGNYDEYYYGTDPKFFEINLIVSMNWNADSSYFGKMAKGMRKASDYLFDVTDGLMYFRVVHIYDNKVKWDNAHMRVEPGTANDKNDHHWPHASVDKYRHKKVGNSGCIVMPQKFDHDKIFGGSNPDKGSYYRTIIHEWGHYGIGLYDEYVGPGGDAECKVCIMDNQYGKSEMCTVSNHDPDKDTNQEDYHGECCWKTFFDNYNTRLFFDLDNNNVKDTTYHNSYTAKSKSHDQIDGSYVIIRTHNS